MDELQFRSSWKRLSRRGIMLAPFCLPRPSHFDRFCFFQFNGEEIVKNATCPSFRCLVTAQLDYIATRAADRVQLYHQRLTFITANKEHHFKCIRMVV